ncbi:VOC family protein [Paludibacterium paludis]|uniref:VOC domain-containing protein n=1 Tax=Paludibacterium paludis TaxID=1225769 RepID=A0A918P5Y0_9NEIS|nr:VOC family protein [Paludibacterium paludis]GGY23693.1 hypothetical protein GCM10011289_29190 [Paludibacterium paludis]
MTVFKGIYTVIYQADDLALARNWFCRAFSMTPYFDEPFYVGFNVGGFELGLQPDAAKPGAGSNQVAYWGVDDIEAAIIHLTELGAELMSPVTDVGEGILVATVRNPFGHVIGVIRNPNFTR